MLIPINEIRVGKRLRALHELTVDQLVESIQKLGLQVPVSVVTGREKDADGVSFELVAGHHRLQACRRLGWHDIEAQIVHLNDNQRELWEIDENLCRAELSELERAEHLAKRKEVYERLHPETRAGSGAELAQKRWGYATDNLSAASSFAADTAEKIGTTARDIRRSTHRATKIDPAVRDRIRDKPEIADSGVEIDALASLKPGQQGDAVSLVESGRAADIWDAKRLIEPTPPRPEPQIASCGNTAQRRNRVQRLMCRVQRCHPRRDHLAQQRGKTDMVIQFPSLNRNGASSRLGRSTSL